MPFFNVIMALEKKHVSFVNIDDVRADVIVTRMSERIGRLFELLGIVAGIVGIVTIVACSS